MTHRYSAIASLVSTCLLCAFLTGCALTSTADPNPLAGTEISGAAFGGQQAISGAKVYLLAANPAGYGSASLSLLTTATTGNTVDTIGAYTTTAANTGSFTVASDYSCTKGYALGATTASGGTTLSGNEQVYLYILGGNAGAGTNAKLGMMAALGPCNALYSTKIKVNEVTTVAAAYAFSGFATDATHVSSSGTALALTGLSNAGLNASNLASLSTGLPVSSTTDITRPVANLYTIANMIAACVDSNGSSTACTTLFQYTESAGASGTAATNTANAAFNLAHNPWPTAAGMAALYALVPATGAPFPGSLTSQPNDFTLGLSYTGGGLNVPFGIAIDNSGNAWVANQNGNSVTELSSTGSALSPSSGFSLGGTTYNTVPTAVAVDVSNHVWVANQNSSLYELSSSGSLMSPASGYFGGGINSPLSLAIDASGYVWTANAGNNSLSKFTSTGGAVSSSTGYITPQNNSATTDPLTTPYCIAFDAGGSVWACGTGANDIVRFNSNGGYIGYYGGGNQMAPFGIAFDGSGDPWIADGISDNVTELTLTSGQNYFNYSGGGLAGPLGIAIDGAGNVWAANFALNSSGNSSGTSVTELSSSGVALSPSTGYTGGGINGPVLLAIDGSGDVWVTNSGTTTSESFVTELIGAASPVVTPLVASLRAPYTATAAKP